MIPDDRALEEVRESELPVLLKESRYPSIRKFLEYLPEEEREDWAITRAEEERLRKQLAQIRRGALGAIPMLCMGEACPVHMICPLHAMGRAPVGRPCPLEASLADEKEAQLKQELGVDDMNITQLHLLQDLVETYVLDWRMSAQMAQTGIIHDVVVGISPDGIPITKREPSAAYTIKMQQKRRQDAVLKQFIATRESQAKLVVGMKSDPSTWAANLLRKSQELKEKAEEARVVEAP